VIVVERSAPLLTVQDAGRVGFFAAGVTQSGPLDPLALAVGNALVGNGAQAAALEGCLGGAQFRCDEDGRVALTGADLVIMHNGVAARTYAPITVRAGDAITVERVTRGAVWYLAVEGGIDVPPVLGSRSTLLAAELGGIDGRPVKTGARLGVGARGERPAIGSVPDSLHTSLDQAAIPLTAGPRADALLPGDWDVFYQTTFTVSQSVSRVGYRLECSPLPSRLPADLASEPACRGAMQLPPEGRPIVLMADHPTIGGYPIIGVVPAHAIGRLAQRAPGSNVQFVAMAVDEAIAAQREQRNALSKWTAHR
jgi:biotin-dependent carboxylase-like uncharacterized protein